MMIIAKFIIAIVAIYIYYNWIKQLIFRHAPYIARRLKLTKRYPVLVAAGVVQLAMIAITHGMFCVILFYLFQIKSLGQISFNLPLLLLGFVIGMGCVGLATVLCQAGMLAGEIFFPKQVPTNAKSWLTIARGGWMRHHLHNIEVFPIWVASLIILLQISAEEIVFRAIMFNFFLEFGKTTAILVSTALFSYMQVFHMASRASAMFPVLGALVLGSVNGLLYANVPMLLPLIVAHLAFFIIAVL